MKFLLVSHELKGITLVQDDINLYEFSCLYSNFIEKSTLSMILTLTQLTMSMIFKNFIAKLVLKIM